MAYSVYIIYSRQIDSYYIGSTSDMDGRLRRHNSNHKGFTGKSNDWKIIYTECYSEKKLALNRERELKSWKSRTRIEKLLNSAGAEAHSSPDHRPTGR
jgi:putative endonuclease